MQAGKPLHCKEIAKRVLAAGFLETKGKTPSQTVYASIQVEIKKKGAQSRFCQSGPGVFALTVGVRRRQHVVITVESEEHIAQP